MKTLMFVTMIFGALSGYSSLMIQKISYQKETNSLIIDVQFGGGCRQHEFALTPIFDLRHRAESNYYFYLNHVKGADDPCRAIIRRKLSFPLKEKLNLPATVRVSLTADGSHPYVVNIPR